jgi:drug/metabolite transporter (DMT)-like permease
VIKLKAILLGISASFFFAFTFILNRQMNLSGGSWIWSASLRYFFMLPILFIIVSTQGQLMQVLKNIIKEPMNWIIWSTVGFGLFYAPLCLASVYGTSWLVAGTWQLTIICGALLSPLFFKTIKTENGILRERVKIPRKALSISFIILCGIFLIQFQQAKETPMLNIVMGIVPVIIAAFAYPLGNRKMMQSCQGKFNTIQRVFGMTLCSMPFWIILSAFGAAFVGLPNNNQIIQSLVVAICSGVLATLLFFKATDIVQHNTNKLAAVEATQSGEVIFTLLGGVLILKDSFPTLIGITGLLLIVLGIVLNSITSYD